MIPRGLLNWSLQLYINAQMHNHIWTVPKPIKAFIDHNYVHLAYIVHVYLQRFKNCVVLSMMLRLQGLMQGVKGCRGLDQPPCNCDPKCINNSMHDHSCPADISILLYIFGQRGICPNHLSAPLSPPPWISHEEHPESLQHYTLLSITMHVNIVYKIEKRHRKITCVVQLNQIVDYIKCSMHSFPAGGAQLLPSNPFIIILCMPLLLEGAPPREGACANLYLGFSMLLTYTVINANVQGLLCTSSVAAR